MSDLSVQKACHSCCNHDMPLYTAPDLSYYTNMQPARRKFLLQIGRVSALGALGTLAWRLGLNSRELLAQSWQIDGSLCQACGACSNNCTLPGSAVRACLQQKDCRQCGNCSAWKKRPKGAAKDAARQIVCPQGAISVQQGEDGSVVTIDHKLCNGCGKCVQACRFDAIVLRIDAQSCLDCNQCSIALKCPSANAIRRS